MARRTMSLTLMTISVILIASSAAHTQQDPVVVVRVDDAGVARGNGVTVVPVFVTCAGGVVLEALMTLSQDDQFTFGMAGIPGVTCDGIERKHAVEVRAVSGTFHRGPAFASAFALICGASTCIGGNASRIVTLRGRP